MSCGSPAPLSPDLGDEGEEPLSLLDLPPELLMLIFTFVPARDVFIHVSLTCRELSAVPSLPGFWRLLCEARLVSKRFFLWNRSESLPSSLRSPLLLEWRDAELRLLDTRFKGDWAEAFKVALWPLVRFRPDWCSNHHIGLVSEGQRIRVSEDRRTVETLEETGGSFPTIPIGPALLEWGGRRQISVLYHRDPASSGVWVHFGAYVVSKSLSGSDKKIKMNFVGGDSTWLGAPASSWSVSLHGFSFWGVRTGSYKHDPISASAKSGDIVTLVLDLTDADKAQGELSWYVNGRFLLRMRSESVKPPLVAGATFPAFGGQSLVIPSEEEVMRVFAAEKDRSLENPEEKAEVEQQEKKP